MTDENVTLIPDPMAHDLTTTAVPGAYLQLRRKVTSTGIYWELTANIAETSDNFILYVVTAPGITLRPAVIREGDHQISQVQLVDDAGRVLATQVVPHPVPEPNREAIDRQFAINAVRNAGTDPEQIVDALIALGWGKLPPEPEPEDWDDTED